MAVFNIEFLQLIKFLAGLSALAVLLNKLSLPFLLDIFKKKKKKKKKKMFNIVNSRTYSSR